MQILNLEMLRGDTFIFNLAVTDAAGDPMDLTGCTITMTVKRNLGQTDPEATFQASTAEEITIDNEEAGLATIEIPPEMTSDLSINGSQLECFYDIQVKNTGLQVFTVARGKFKILADVTRAT